MATYTIEVRDIVRMFNKNDHVGFISLDKQLENAAPHIFDFDFPIFEESYRLTLEKKILRHYLMREICAETLPLWQVFLERRLTEIMPYYNELYKTTLYSFNPSENVNLTTTHVQGENEKTGQTSTKGGSTTEEGQSGTINGGEKVTDTTGSTNGKSTRTDNLTSTAEGEDNGTVTNNSTTLDSDFPQATLNAIGNYGTESTQGEGTSTNESKTKSKTTNTGTQGNTEEAAEQRKDSQVWEDNTNTTSTNEVRYNTTDSLESNTDNNMKYEHKMFGNDGRYTLAYLIKEYRESIINIDMMIINDLSDLFMLIY